VARIAAHSAALAFQHVAELQHVLVDTRVVAQDFLPRVAEARIQAIRDESAPALPAIQQPARGELLDRLAQARARNAELRRQFPLGRKPVARLKAPLKHALFDLARDNLCGWCWPPC
jgi:hypothetical protein